MGTLWVKKFKRQKFLDLNFSLDQVAEHLVLLHGVSVSQARSAYAALLLIPGFDQLRFNPLLCRCKKLWNVSEAKYSHFWSVEILVQKLAREKLDWANMEAVRNRLILCWRLFALHRSVDLARLYRKISFGGGGGSRTPPLCAATAQGLEKTSVGANCRARKSRIKSLALTSALCGSDFLFARGKLSFEVFETSFYPLVV